MHRDRVVVVCCHLRFLDDRILPTFVGSNDDGDN